MKEPVVCGIKKMDLLALILHQEAKRLGIDLASARISQEYFEHASFSNGFGFGNGFGVVSGAIIQLQLTNDSGAVINVSDYLDQVNLQLNSSTQSKVIAGFDTRFLSETNNIQFYQLRSDLVSAHQGALIPVVQLPEDDGTLSVVVRRALLHLTVVTPILNRC